MTTSFQKSLHNLCNVKTFFVFYTFDMIRSNKYIICSDTIYLTSKRFFSEKYYMSEFWRETNTYFSIFLRKLVKTVLSWCSNWLNYMIYTLNVIRRVDIEENTSYRIIATYIWSKRMIDRFFLIFLTETPKNTC
jgi:hypothetical protein